MLAAVGSAQARVGFLGNPSDGYGGRVIAFTLRERGAKVRFVPTPGAAGIALGGVIALGGGDGVGGGDGLGGGDGAQRALTVHGLPELLRAEDGGRRLLAAACTRFGQRAPDALAAAARAGFALEFETDVPRQAGLAGSSAIIIAALRALCAGLDIALDPLELAELALRAETDDLGIPAGPQDRVVQACEGLLFMDFAAARPQVVRLDPRTLPPLYLAWQHAPGAPSGLAHGDLRRRFEGGEREVLRAMETFAEIADEGRRCLAAGDHERLRALMDANFETRAAIMEVSAADRERIAIGRANGAGVKLTGSGGAVVGLPREPGDLDALEAAYRAAGHAFLRCRTPDRSPRAAEYRT